MRMRARLLCRRMSARLTEAQLRSVHGLLAANADPSGVFRVSESDVPADDPRVAVAVLERAGALELFPARSGAFSGRLAEPTLSRRHSAAAMVAMERQQKLRWGRLEADARYA